MNQKPYKRKIGVTIVPQLWICAALWPFLFYLGLSDLTQFHFYLSLLFICSTYYSVHQGLYAFKHKEYSDFIVLTIVPVTLPMLLFVLYLSNR
jgi:hypothetical protein